MAKMKEDIMPRAFHIMAVLFILCVSLMASSSQGGTAKDARLYINQAKKFINNRQYDQAIAILDQAIQIDPNNALAYNYRGIAYYRSKSYEEALADFNKAIQLNPNLAMAYNNRAYAYFRKKDYSKAEKDLLKAQALNCNISKEFLRNLRLRQMTGSKN
jgi:Flp pilus assembly protein TadD